MKKLISRSIITISLLALVAYLGITYFLLSGITSGSYKPLVVQPDTTRVSYENISFTPRDAKFQLSGWFIKAAKPTTNTVIFVHGIATNRVSNKHTLDLAYSLTERGFNVLMFDQRNQGDSEGEFSSASFFEKYDVLGAFDYLIKQRKIPSDKIVVHGFSMGGATAILAASIEPRIQTLIIDSPFADARELIAQETSHATGAPLWFSTLFIPMLKLYAKCFYSIEIDKMVPMEAVKQIKMPILMFHGTADKRLHFSNSQRIHKNSHNKSMLVLVDGADHSSSYATDKSSYLKKIFSYFKSRTK